MHVEHFRRSAAWNRSNVAWQPMKGLEDVEGLPDEPTFGGAIDALQTTGCQRSGFHFEFVEEAVVIQAVTSDDEELSWHGD